MSKTDTARREREQREQWVREKLRELRRLVRQLPRWRQRSLLDALDADQGVSSPPPRTH